MRFAVRTLASAASFASEAGLSLSIHPDLHSFIRDHVRSVWALELLLLLRRQPDRVWTAEALLGELRASTAIVAAALGQFERGGLVLADDGGAYRYAPASDILRDLCDGLEEIYRERPVAVINAIASPAERLQGLADAFKFKGDGK